jgi:hypothetical protein
VELFKIIAQNGEKKFLVQIFDGFVIGLGVMESQCLSDRVINQRRILKDESVPGSLVSGKATGKEALLFLGHSTFDAFLS